MKKYRNALNAEEDWKHFFTKKIQHLIMLDAKIKSAVGMLQLIGKGNGLNDKFNYRALAEC